MLVLDENLPAGQRRLLRDWRIHFRTIGDEVAVIGTLDENLLPILHGLSRPTFFTLDRDFFRRDWLHVSYCLAWLDVADDWAAAYIRRFLKHPAFNSQAKRMGTVVRIHPGGIQCWRPIRRSLENLTWPQQ